ncbi:MAG: AAA family ATPase [Paracoccaceae bacterium]
MNPALRITKLSFSGGDTIVLGANDKVLLVGPNNAGKSQALRDIQSCIRDRGEQEPLMVIRSVEFERSGTAEDVGQFMSERYEKHQGHFQVFGHSVHASSVKEYWQLEQPLRELTSAFVRHVGAEDRLKITHLADSKDPDHPSTAPQHFLHQDESLLREISRVFREAFRVDLFIDYVGGSKIPFHVGQLPGPECGSNPIGNLYVEAVRRQPRLDRQGDGMRSYAGILFETLVRPLDVTLVDEPEAFLHPPQMRRLGRTLAEKAQGQLIVATHSSDVLRGFIEGTKGDNLRILRITREGETNRVHEAEAEVLKELWEKPEFRYSNALDGVFHELSVICEDDSDCRLYNAMADFDAETGAYRYADTAYIPTGGKQRAPKIASVLKRIGLPIVSVFDLDLFADRGHLQSMVESVGGDWETIEPLWRRVEAGVSNGVKVKTFEEIQNYINQAFQICDDGKVPEREIKSALKQLRPWQIVKKSGEAALPKGQLRTTLDELKKVLADMGIYVVAVGEAEGFAPEIGIHGPGFVSKLLEEISLGDQKLGGLRAFVREFHRAENADESPESTPASG